MARALALLGVIVCGACSSTPNSAPDGGDTAAADVADRQAEVDVDDAGEASDAHFDAVDGDDGACVAAGQVETTTAFPRCCPGLVNIHVGSEDAGRCTGNDIYTCTRCGNGTCESWEDRCSCPADCGTLPADAGG